MNVLSACPLRTAREEFRCAIEQLRYALIGAGISCTDEMVTALHVLEPSQCLMQCFRCFDMMRSCGLKSQYQRMQMLLSGIGCSVMSVMT